MKIVQVAARFNPFIGGIENYCYGLSKKLAELGHDVEIITSRLDKNWSSIEEKEGFKIIRCPFLGDLLNVNPLTFIINKLIKAKPDLIHTHSHMHFTSNQVALIKRFNNVPNLLHLHGNIDYSLPKNDIKTYLFFQIKNKIYDRTLGNWTVQAADKIASVSKIDMKNAIKLWNLDSDKICWLPNAIDINSFNGNNCNDHLNVVFIGRLEPWKGVHTFIKAARMILKERDDVTFTLVGDGSLRNHVENNGYTDRIKVLGEVPYNQIPNILSNASILVLPSYMEGLPTVCLEALASKVPVVASNIGGIPEIVIDGKTGYLFPPGNAELFADRILRLLANESLRSRMGRNGLRLVKKLYTWDKVVKMAEKTYESMSYSHA